MRFRGSGVRHSFLPIANHDAPPEPEEVTLNEEDLSRPLDASTILTETEIVEVNAMSSSESEDGSEYGGSGGEADQDLGSSDDDFDPEDGEGSINDTENQEGFNEL